MVCVWINKFVFMPVLGGMFVSVSINVLIMINYIPRICIENCIHMDSCISIAQTITVVYNYICMDRYNKHIRENGLLSLQEFIRNNFRKCFLLCLQIHCY